MATRKRAHNFDKGRVQDDESFGEVLEFTLGGRKWVIQPKKIPAGITMGFFRAIEEGENTGAVLNFYDNMIHFFMYLLGVEEGTRFAELLMGTGVPEELVVDVGEALEVGNWVLEQLSDRPT